MKWMVMGINKNSSTLMKLFQKRVFFSFYKFRFGSTTASHTYIHTSSIHSRFIFRIIFVLQMSKNVIICLSCCWMGHLRECSHSHTSHSSIYQESVFMTDIWMYSKCEWTDQNFYFDLVFIVFGIFFRIFPIFLFFEIDYCV